MRRSGVRTLGLGLLAFVLGCDLAEIDKAGQPNPSSAPPPAPSAPSAPALPAPAPPPPPVVPAPTAAAKEPVLGLSAGAALAGLFVNQLRVTPASQQATMDHFRASSPQKAAALRHELTFYAVFKAPFARRIEVRALDERSVEIGRSEREAAISQPTDSARYVTVRFDARLPLERVWTYVVFVDPAPESPAGEPVPTAPKAPPGPPKGAEPAPEPQPLHAPRPGLVPKDP